MEQERSELVTELLAERARQLEIWGEQRREPEVWVTVLASELGEIGEALVNVRVRGEERWWPYYRSGLIQLAAVALAAAEDFDAAGRAGPDGG